VGDFKFQNQCLEKIKSFRSHDKAIILVSHEPGTVKNFCDETIWLENGQIRKHGFSKGIVDFYLGANRERRGKDSLHNGGEYLSSEEVEIINLEFAGSDRKGKDIFITGEELHVIVEYRTNIKICRPLFGLSFTRNDNVLVYATSSGNDGASPEMIAGKGCVEISFDSFPLVIGTYIVTVTISDKQSLRSYAQAKEVIRMQIKDKTWGICRLEPKYNFQRRYGEN
jgi:energy-coupling factor transporter ATP-binding protein EcfA2